MRPRCPFPALLLWALFASACDSPAGPTAEAGYPGEWTGTTAQGRPITFTISSDEHVTAITVGYQFNGCSGSQTFTDLRLAIAPQVQCIPAPCSPQISAFRSFNYSAGDRLDGPSTTVSGIFPLPGRAEGVLHFRNFSGCGNALSVGWSASRR